MEEHDLWELKVGQCAHIAHLDDSIDDKAMLRRLTDMGFVEGSEVCCVLCAASGEPKAFFVRGSVIALRREAAMLIKTGAIYEKEG